MAALVMLSGCGGEATPRPVAPSTPVAAPTEPPPDVTAVPEPASLLFVGRIKKPDAVLRTVGSWVKLPLPGGADLVRSVADDAIGDAVDFAQPIDAAAALGGSKRSPKPLMAISVGVKSFADAKAHLARRHELKRGDNGQLIIEHVGAEEAKPRRDEGGDEEDERGDERGGVSCVLGHAPAGARLVCGDRPALDLLVPYMTRTLPRRTFPSDVHLELMAAPLRESAHELQAALPGLARALLGGSNRALGTLIDAATTELVDVVDDTERVAIDADLSDAGIAASLKIDYGHATSVAARLATSHPERAAAPPAAFFRLPAETDLAAYSTGADRALLDHPRELVANLLSELTEGAGLPEPERKALRDLVANRTLGALTGATVYGKGYDAEAVEKAIAARDAARASAVAARDAAQLAVVEQALGWHLLQVSDSIANVAPALKEWAGLWNRPAFAAWAGKRSTAKMLAKLRIAPIPAGIALPKESVHLEIVVPREEAEPTPLAKAGPGAAGKDKAPPARAKTTKVALKPAVLHVFAVPDQGTTWIGFGLDAKLVARKLALSVSTTPDGATLAKAPTAEPLRHVNANGAWLATLRGLLVFTTLDGEPRGAFAGVGSLPSKGNTPLTFAWSAKPPSPAAAAGSLAVDIKLPRAAIEDMVKLAMTAH